MLEINWNPDARTLRWFAGLQIVFFAVLSYVWREALGTTGATVLIAASIVLGAVGLARPAWVRWIYVAWMVAVFPIGWVMSHIILAVIYYVVLTPVALVVRWRKDDPLHREIDPAAATYWTERRPDENVTRYFRQY
jgi:Saxitoxin biosynthesis operon protein SxtJ